MWAPYGLRPLCDSSERIYNIAHGSLKKSHECATISYCVLKIEIALVIVVHVFLNERTRDGSLNGS